MNPIYAPKRVLLTLSQALVTITSCPTDVEVYVIDKEILDSLDYSGVQDYVAGFPIEFQGEVLEAALTFA